MTVGYARCMDGHVCTCVHDFVPARVSQADVAVSVLVALLSCVA